MMHGIWKMLTGEGERLNREKRRRFREAIPDSLPFVAGPFVRYGAGELDYRVATDEERQSLPNHPAYSGEFENTMMALNYRQAVFGGGGPMPKPKVVVAPETEAAAEDMTFGEWLKKFGIPLPGGGV